MAFSTKQATGQQIDLELAHRMPELKKLKDKDI
jgi:hypothetical protein